MNGVMPALLAREDLFAAEIATVCNASVTEIPAPAINGWIFAKVSPLPPPT
jgi:hypothetical protein